MLNVVSLRFGFLALKVPRLSFKLVARSESDRPRLLAFVFSGGGGGDIPFALVFGPGERRVLEKLNLLEDGNRWCRGTGTAGEGSGE
jgi:hypothetical protein